MKKQIASAVLMLCAGMVVSSCQKESVPHSPAAKSFDDSKSIHRATSAKAIQVTNVLELYAAINDPENSGSTLVLSPGTYSLQPAYPKGGRLELQHNMALLGQPGHPEQVIIDATGLPITSLNTPPDGRTGVVRMGNGTNSIEWLTIQNDPSHTQRSLIQTDITATPVTQIRVAHCILKGSNIGINVINRQTAANGRTVIAELEHNEITNNIFPQFGTGIQIQNSNGGIKDAVIKATLRNNYIHGNLGGIEAFNASAQNCRLEVASYNDKVESNGVGIILFAGFSESTTYPALHNSLTFEAHATSVRNNTGPPPVPYTSGGVFATAGDAFPPFAPPGSVHYNNLEVSFYGSPIEGNAGVAQILAFGGHSFFASSTPVGTFNRTVLNLYGLSKQATVAAVNSVPPEPAGTNTVAVHQ
jgi:hypothetical protein